jgi:hypothetical protein
LLIGGARENPDADDSSSEIDSEGDDNEEDDNSRQTDRLPIPLVGGPGHASVAGQLKHARRPLPVWLQDAFSKCSAIAKNIDSPAHPYKHGTFWFPQKSSSFIISDHHQNLTPQHLFAPRFFLWDPMRHPGVKSSITCVCGNSLSRSEISRPRRVVDVTGPFWIIGWRYKCKTCQKPRKEGAKSQTFCSWDPHILNRIPKHIAADFPAILTHRRAISKTFFDYFRPCLSEMGTLQVANAFRVATLKRYDELQLQYKQSIYAQAQASETLTNRNMVFPDFPEFNDRSPSGYHGYTPSSQLLRDVFDNFVEDHKNEINQHTSMLPASVIAIDHSFKVPKQIVKECGVPIYSGLFCMTTELGQIRILNLVSTKSHAQFEPHLQQMSQSLTLFGHEQPQAAYTDNIADQPLLERCFPSLRADVIPVEKYSHLPLFTIPSTISITACKEIGQIDHAIRTILDLAGDNPNFTVGFDMEWDVDMQDNYRQDVTAVIQIAYENHIFIFQVSVSPDDWPTI